PRRDDDASRADGSYAVDAPNGRERVRRGTTLPEIIIAVIVLGIVTAVAGLRVAGFRDRSSVRRATDETVATFAAARRWSLSRSARTAVSIDTANATLLVRSYADTILLRRLGDSHGVVLSTSRDSMAYAPNGLGYGASNLTLVLRRGEAAETVVVSRLGRVRRTD
ncbi:MAG TPA: type II secretion system protein, partial [Gemmatimonadaceae bacterium]|nr:type II secretion system protein [Gemmatimonadaceae bacterium]